MAVPISWDNGFLGVIVNASTASNYYGKTAGSVPLMYNRRKSETEQDIYYIEGLIIGINDSHSISRMAESSNFRACII